jgi:hypothetical protein
MRISEPLLAMTADIFHEVKTSQRVVDTRLLRVFHSFCKNLLRPDAKSGGFPNAFSEGSIGRDYGKHDEVGFSHSSWCDDVLASAIIIMISS